MENLEKNKHIWIENIKGFSIIEKDGKKLLSIVLQEGEKIELHLSLHIRELHDILSVDKYEYTKDVLFKLLQRTESQSIQQNREREIAFQAWLNLPKNQHKKEFIRLSRDCGMEKLPEILDIHSDFSDTYQSNSSFDFKDLDELTKMNILLEIIDADKK